MLNPSDHDLLIQLHSKVDNIQESSAKQMTSLAKLLSNLATTVTAQNTAMEIRLRDVEGKAQRCDVQISNNTDDIKALQKRSNLSDYFLAVVTIAGSIIGTIFGQQKFP